MKLGKQTIDILKNFSSINSSIVIEEGNVLQTISAMKNILAKAEVTDTFEKRFAIYDLVEFLNIATDPIYDGAEYKFNEVAVGIEGGSAKTKYYYADESTIVSPTKQITMPDTEIEFLLNESDVKTIQRHSSIMGKSDIQLRSHNGEIVASVMDKKDPTSNSFELSLGDAGDESFTMYFKVENLRLFDGDYDAKISSQSISHFSHTEIDLQYWIALEPDSTYGE
tara:strand:+ start:4440 stop:5111 length:672 start_codon:yes stop_codon:yes gene_type:complete